MDTNEIVMPGIHLKKLIAQKYEPILAEYDLRPVEIDILVFLKKTDSDTARDIIQCKHLSKAHVSKSIDNLKSKGFISLVEDEDDHRIMHISLTDKSDEVISMAREVYEECIEIMTRGVDREDIEVVKKVMLKVNENIIEALD
ncbi:MAG: winged helix DNA-binding protein [Saccharofermentans sp.]|nr:winged helix DNA-binding protein [Saccharofermentans sp.]